MTAVQLPSHGMEGVEASVRIQMGWESRGVVLYRSVLRPMIHFSEWEPLEMAHMLADVAHCFVDRKDKHRDNVDDLCPRPGKSRRVDRFPSAIPLQNDKSFR